MAGQFRVEPAGLGVASGRLDTLAGQLGSTDLTGPLKTAAGAVPGSDTAGRATRLSGEVATCQRALVTAVRATASAHTSASGNYTATDTGNADAFRGLHGGPTP